MPLWSPDDPYGLGTLRKALIALAIFFAVFGTYRSLMRDGPLVVFLLAAAVALTIGLFVEAAVARIRGE